MQPVMAQELGTSQLEKPGANSVKSYGLYYFCFFVLQLECSLKIQ